MPDDQNIHGNLSPVRGMRLRVLISAYACEPNRGSEPGVGWHWALGMARRHETYVLTRANNREVIESEIARLGVPERDRPKFLYVDLPGWICRLKKAHVISIGLFYLLWQFTARRAFDRSGIHVDIIHHVTFNSFVCPGVWWNRREKVVIGPLGGTSVCPSQYLRVFAFVPRCKEFIRGLMRQFPCVYPFYVIAVRNADYVIHTNEKDLAYSTRMGKRSCQMLETGIDEGSGSIGRTDLESRDRKMVWAGTLGGHKACEIAIRAYARAFRGDSLAPIFKIYGTGSDRPRLESMAKKMDVSGKISFEGNVSQQTLWDEMRSALCFVFTSVRDTSGNAALESMACQAPVICFNHQGVGMMTDDSCAIRIEPNGWDEVINGFANAMKRLSGDPKLVEAMGCAGRNRALSKFSWEAKFDAADAIYRALLGS